MASPGRYKDRFTGQLVLDERYPVTEDLEKGVYVARGKFKPIFTEGSPEDNDRDTLEVTINLVRDFNLTPIRWTMGKFRVWARNYVRLVKKSHKMDTIDQFHPFVSTITHLVRLVSARFPDFRFYRPEGEAVQTVIFCSFLEDETTAVFWFPIWSLERAE
jgi:hypothetical protein